MVTLGAVNSELDQLVAWADSQRLTDLSRVEAAQRASSFVKPPDAELSAMLQETMERIPAAIGGLITFVEAALAVSKVAVGSMAESWLNQEVSTRLSFCSAVVDTGDALLIADAERETHLRACVEEVNAPRGYIGVPFRFEGRIIGACAMLGAANAFTPADVEVLRSLVPRVEAAIAERSTPA